MTESCDIKDIDLADAGLAALAGMFSSAVSATYGLLNLLCMIAFAYCVVKIFFANIKRGGILLIQMAVGALYMFSVPRGYQDGFNQWMKQIAALCLTAFMQTSLLFLGLLTFPGNMLLVHIPLFFQLNPFVAQCLYHLFIIGSPNNIWLKHMHQRFLVFA